MSPFSNQRRPSRFGKILLIALAGALPLAAADPKPAEILMDMKRVADWQLANPSKHAAYDWTQAPFYMGLANLHQVSGEKTYLDALDGIGKSLSYGPGPRLTHADDHAVLQAWLDLESIDHDEAKLQPSIAHFEKLTAALSKQSPATISGGTFTWCWCDALFMSPAVWAHLSQLTGDPKYLEFADREWWTTTDMLYDPTHHLFYRDNRYFAKRTPSGKKVFWSRGNGWVAGGLVNMLDCLPADHPSREKYLGLYHDMMYSLLKLQNADGLWRTSLLDPQDPGGESSGSAFFTQAMAWGINRGLLPAVTFKPVVMRGYAALAGNIQPDGMMGFVQKIGEAPDNKDTTAASTEVYGSGAFLLAGAEIIRLLDPSKGKSDVVSFKGVKLPEKFMPHTPRTFARFIPERADDFAWENDLVAFRTYGPALRPGAENSGFDCWFKRVPYPIIDKWYLEDRLKLPYGKINKSYHDDQGEGHDVYHVGNSRGCGGISVVADGEMHDSDTFIAQRVISSTPEKTVFELDYASDLNGKVLRETKRITIIMGQRLFQCDSRFTLDGKPAAFDVAIGILPQVKGTQPEFSPESGTMRLWEKLDGLGLGTGIAIDPKSVVKMESRTDKDGQTQAFCFARTDAEGHIRWFSGFGWEGQGEITTGGKWAGYLKDFAAKFVKAPFADYSGDATFKTHSLPVPAAKETSAVESAPGAVMVKQNGGWCWFQDPRAIVTKDGSVVFSTISGDTYGGHDAGDLAATMWNPETGKTTEFELSDKFQSDDHDVAALMERPDGKILAVYGKHSTDDLQRWRITTKAGEISGWSEEKTFAVGDHYSYSNVYRLPAENGRTYNFSRSRGYNPNCNISEDDGDTWKYGWRLFSWTEDDLKDNPRFTGIDGCRPYVRYASNGKDTIHFVTTEDHPRAYDNSIYHGFYRGGKLHDSTGNVLADSAEGISLKPTSFTKIFDGGADKVAWTTDLELDTGGNPYITFSVQLDGAKDRGKSGAAHDGMDHRYFYARFDGGKWATHPMAFAGTRLYANEDDYTGLVALDPQDPDTVVISTNADPATGTPLLSQTDQKRHWELFRGKTSDQGKTWSWTAITHASTVDNLRPNIPSNPGGKRIILWTRGELKTYKDFHLDVFALAETR